MQMPDAFSYLEDRRDRFVAAATPTLVAPRFGALPPVPMGQHRFVIAGNGLFVEARTEALALRLRIAQTPTLPYGVCEEYVWMAAGPLPSALYEEMRDRAVRRCPDEWAGVVHYDPARNTYELQEPEAASRSRAHIRYSTDALDYDRLVLDIHSHGHGEARFSSVDDADDQYGIYLATVLGRCGSAEGVTATTRVVVHGLHVAVRWNPWRA